MSTLSIHLESVQRRKSLAPSARGEGHQVEFNGPVLHGAGTDEDQEKMNQKYLIIQYINK